MKIWHLNFELDKYDNFIPIKDLTIEEIQSFDGRSKKDTWVMIDVKKIKNKRLSNAPGFYSHVPVFDNYALDSLNDLISPNIEVLPIRYGIEIFYAINVVKVLDCVDYEKSDFDMFSDKKRIMCFNKYAFLSNVINENNIFKIKDEPVRRPFVSDKFKTRVEEKKLKGFKFKLVWTDEE